MKETLPVDQAISVSGFRNCVWAVGKELDHATESAIRGELAYPPAESKVKIFALAINSAWLRHRPSQQEQDKAKLAQYFLSKRVPSTGRHVNIIAGRAVLVDGSCKVVGYVNREVTSAATRLDHFSRSKALRWTKRSRSSPTVQTNSKKRLAGPEGH